MNFYSLTLLISELLKFYILSINILIDIIDEEKCEGIITEILERTVYLKRPKVANITQIMLVVSIKNPKPDLELLDKQLIMAEKNNVFPIICINKIDLAEDYEEIIRTYEQIGYQVLTTDAKNGIGIDKLAVILHKF